MADREELRKTVSYKRGSDIFKEKFSNPKNLMNKTAVSPNDYEREFDKWLNEFKNNNGKDFDRWLAGFKKTHVCDDEEFEDVTRNFTRSLESMNGCQCYWNVLKQKMNC